jgi:hypothetical protein
VSYVFGKEKSYAKALEAQRQLEFLPRAKFFHAISHENGRFFAAFSCARPPQVFLKNFSSRLSILYAFLSNFEKSGSHTGARAHAQTPKPRRLN